MAASFSLCKPITPCLRLNPARHAPPRSLPRGVPPARAAASGKGFGAKKEKPVPKKAPRQPPNEREDEERAVSQILQKLEAEGAASSGEEGVPSKKGTQGTQSAPLLDSVDRRIASKGRVDYVRVEGWEPHAKGGPKDLEDISPEDLGDLPVRSFSQGTSLAPGQGNGRRSGPQQGVPESGEGGVQSESPSQPLPLYEDLVRYLQLLDSKGEISVARPKGAAPLPPFERWSFGDERFLQYLVDLQCVHVALESAVSQATSAQEALPSSSNPTSSGSVEASPLAGFGPALGLQRSGALADDVAAIRAALAEGSAGKERPLPQLADVATTQAQAHASYINSIARGLDREPEAGEGRLRRQKGSAIGGSRRAELRLVANLFALYIANLTTGMRIGAKAMECVPAMRQARAVKFFQQYPGHVDDPLKVFTGAVDDLGLRLSEEDKDVLKEELPKGVIKTSLLLSVLAVEAAVVAS